MAGCLVAGLFVFMTRKTRSAYRQISQTPAALAIHPLHNIPLRRLSKKRLSHAMENDCEHTGSPD
jgi:hypothetical protein